MKQRFSKDDPHVRCLPDNPPRTWGMPHLTKAVHTPRLLVLLYEVNAMYRQIFIDGRPQPGDPNPTWNGYSTATWERELEWSAMYQARGTIQNLRLSWRPGPSRHETDHARQVVTKALLGCRGAEVHVGLCGRALISLMDYAVTHAGGGAASLPLLEPAPRERRR